MKNKKTPRVSKNPSKKYIRKFRFYPSFMYNKLDKWLNQMSLSGWHIVDSNLISFLFEQGAPENKIYFTYEPSGSRKDEAKYSIPLRYPFLDKTYGIKSKLSKLNKNERKTYQTIEIDREKIDIENDVGYKELVSDRNRLYKKLAIRNAIILIISLLCVLFAWFVKSKI